MSKPWHGKIVALSLPQLIRDNMGETGHQGGVVRDGRWREGGAQAEVEL